MIRVGMKLPETLIIAVSGGIDSMVSLDFLSRKHTIYPIFFHHGTETSDKALKFLSKNVPNLEIGYLDSAPCPTDNKQAFWSRKRYSFFEEKSKYHGGIPVITCHHLNDSVETWIWNCLNGNPEIIKPAITKIPVLRPLLLNRRVDIENWASHKGVSWIEDESNKNQDYTRNFIRHTMMENALRVNPGLEKIIRKKTLILYQEYKNKY